MKKLPKKQRSKLRRFFEDMALARDKYLRPGITSKETALILMEEWGQHVECGLFVNSDHVRIEMPFNKQMFFLCEIAHETPRKFRFYLCVLGEKHLKIAGSLSKRSVKAVGRVYKRLLRAELRQKAPPVPAAPTNYDKPFRKLKKVPK